MPAPQFKAAGLRLRENISPNRALLETLASGFAGLINMQLEKEKSIRPESLAPRLQTPAYRKGKEEAKKALYRLNQYVREGKIYASQADPKGSLM